MRFTIAEGPRPQRGAASGQRAPDQDPLHLWRPLVDLAHAHIAIDALDGEVAHVAVAAADHRPNTSKPQPLHHQMTAYMLSP